jgi:hypothetical protein
LYLHAQKVQIRHTVIQRCEYQIRLFAGHLSYPCQFSTRYASQNINHLTPNFLTNTILYNLSNLKFLLDIFF